MNTISHTPDKNQVNKSRLAPSEKHLEDWIVANPMLFRMTYVTGEWSILKYIDEIIARQPVFPTGRPDLIAVVDQRLVVIELKRGAITADSVLQCMRYQWDLVTVLNEVCVFQDDYEIAASQFRDFNSRMVTGYVVGNSIAANLLPGMEVAGVDPILYEFDGDDYEFSSVYYDTNTEWHAKESKSGFGTYFRKVLPNICYELKLFNSRLDRGDQS